MGWYQPSADIFTHPNNIYVLVKQNQHVPIGMCDKNLLLFVILIIMVMLYILGNMEDFFTIVHQHNNTEY